MAKNHSFAVLFSHGQAGRARGAQREHTRLPLVLHPAPPARVSPRRWRRTALPLPTASVSLAYTVSYTLHPDTLLTPKPKTPNPQLYDHNSKPSTLCRLSLCRWRLRSPKPYTLTPLNPLHPPPNPNPRLKILNPTTKSLNP